MGTKEQTLPVAWWGRLQGQETPEPRDTRTLAAYPGQEQEALQGAAASTLGCVRPPSPKYPGGAGVKHEGLQVNKRPFLLHAKPPPHVHPPRRPYNNRLACESAGHLPDRRSPSLGAGPKELCRRPLALAPCTLPPAANPSASWPHRGGSSFQRAWEG